MHACTYAWHSPGPPWGDPPWGGIPLGGRGRWGTGQCTLSSVAYIRPSYNHVSACVALGELWVRRTPRASRFWETPKWPLRRGHAPKTGMLALTLVSRKTPRPTGHPQHDARRGPTGASKMTDAPWTLLRETQLQTCKFTISKIHTPTSKPYHNRCIQNPPRWAKTQKKICLQTPTECPYREKCIIMAVQPEHTWYV